MADIKLTNGHNNGVTEESSDDILNNLDGAWNKNRKITDYDMGSRQRKISHRKVIIHDDGEICNKTYNKVRCNDNCK